MIANVTNGPAPDTCPWRAFEEPICADVIGAYPAFESGNIELILGNDPPAHIMAGLMVYHRAYMATRADRMDRARMSGSK